MNDYLPKDSPSTVSLEIMEQEFDGGIPNARVMVENVTMAQALKYKEQIAEIEGVCDITWLDDVADIYIPLEVQDKKQIETFYKDNTALFSVTIEEELRIEAVDDIRFLIGDENAMTGSAVSTAIATESTVKEVAQIAVVGIAFEEYWAYMSRHIDINRYSAPVGRPYSSLLKRMKDKDYFVLTTNVDHQFQKAGFDKHRLFYTQGDYGLWQCSTPCHNRTYDNEEAVKQMLTQQQDLRIPSELIPRCPRCGKPMTMNLRCDNTFVQDDGWNIAASRYEDFIRRHRNFKTLFLELGVGGNTPVIIKCPFWQMTAKNPNATYACINLEEAVAPREIEKRAICIKADISDILQALNCEV
ncbi:hypothetical protein LJC01_02135 [Clostridiaceae bacterium OttesenSCG-928-D20]|nr:hypothetical protein [Clostridiaceae bacterium OttesenSCG-928-D20]